jgi:hypothetical protein
MRTSVCSMILVVVFAVVMFSFAWINASRRGTITVNVSGPSESKTYTSSWSCATAFMTIGPEKKAFDADDRTVCTTTNADGSVSVHNTFLMPEGWKLATNMLQQWTWVDDTGYQTFIRFPERWMAVQDAQQRYHFRRMKPMIDTWRDAQ